MVHKVHFPVIRPPCLPPRRQRPYIHAHPVQEISYGPARPRMQPRRGPRVVVHKVRPPVRGAVRRPAVRQTSALRHRCWDTVCPGVGVGGGIVVVVDEKGLSHDSGCLLPAMGQWDLVVPFGASHGDDLVTCLAVVNLGGLLW